MTWQAPASDGGRALTSDSFTGVIQTLASAGPHLVAASRADTCGMVGAEVYGPEQRDWGGYSGYFTDPDGFRWEVAHNPFPIGDVTLP